MKSETMTFTTTKTLEDIAVIVRNFIAGESTRWFTAKMSKLRDNDPMNGLGTENPDIMLLLEGPGMGVDGWGMQFYVYDHDVTREIEIVIFKHSFFESVAIGNNNKDTGSRDFIYHLRKGRKKAEALKSLLV